MKSESESESESEKPGWEKQKEKIKDQLLEVAIPGSNITTRSKKNE